MKKKTNKVKLEIFKFLRKSVELQGYCGENLNDVWGRLPALPSPPSGHQPPQTR